MNRCIFRDNSGTAAIEYSLIASLISIIAVASMIAIGGSVNGMFESVIAGFGL